MTTETEGPIEAFETSRGRSTFFVSAALIPVRDLNARFKAMDPNNCKDLSSLVLSTVLFTAVLLPVVMIGFLYVIGFGNLLTGNGLNILLGAMGLHLAYCIISPLAKLSWNALRK